MVSVGLVFEVNRRDAEVPRMGTFRVRRHSAAAAVGTTSSAQNPIFKAGRRRQQSVIRISGIMVWLLKGLTFTHGSFAIYDGSLLENFS